MFHNPMCSACIQTKKLDKLRAKYQEVKQEIADVLADNQKEREQLLDTIRELRRHIQLRVGNNSYDF